MKGAKMPKKSGLTLEQHEKVGLELQTISENLTKITVELDNAYPHKISDISLKALRKIDSLRSILDETVCGEHRNLEDADRIYYRVNRADYQKTQFSLRSPLNALG